MPKKIQIACFAVLACNFTAVASTLAIQNLLSMPHSSAPALAADQNVRASLRKPFFQDEIVSPDDPRLAKFSYDVVSIKPFTKASTGNANPEFLQGKLESPDGIEIRNMPLEAVIAWAFDTGHYPKVTGPNWIKNDAFELQGKMDADTTQALGKLSTASQKIARQHMLQVLLADYFKLKTHIETTEVPIYQLVVAKNGSKMEIVAAPDAKPARMLITRPARGVEVWKGNATPIAAMLGQLTFEVGRPVYDKTGLSGLYNFTLRCARESQSVSAVPPDAQTMAGTSPENDAPPLHNALEEQLGLKLESAKGPSDVIVVDRVERPTAN
jgi:uncharacterized protein (TIGR03435 family)